MARETRHKNDHFKAIVIGTSAGGMEALSKILSELPKKMQLAIIIVQHIHASSDRYFIKYFKSKCNLVVKEAEEKEKIKAGIVYFAPPNYHLLIEKDETFSLSIDERVNFSRPSIDVLFESASDVYKKQLIGIILTGANRDGAKGLKYIKKRSGLTIVQDPKTAEIDTMPVSAIESSHVDFILPLEGIVELLKEK